MAHLPYKVIPGTGYDIGSAKIVDRGTGAEVGYVLADHLMHWSAYLASNPGVALVFGVEGVPERLKPIVGDTRPIKITRYRKDAARAVWEAAQKAHDDGGPG